MACALSPMTDFGLTALPMLKGNQELVTKASPVSILTYKRSAFP